jgi:hypothetical protein
MQDHSFSLIGESVMTGPVRYLLLSTALLLAAGLGRTADEPMRTSVYFPTAVGTTWKYRVGENHYSVKVTKHEKIGNLMCARLEMVVNKKTVMTEHIAVTSDAIVRAAFDGKALNPPFPILKLPPRDGDTWKSWTVESKMDGQTFKGTLKAGEQKDLKVIDTKYPSVVTVTGKDLEVNGAKMNLTYYFAEKFGMVRQVTELAGQKIVVELEKFEPVTK